MAKTRVSLAKKSSKPRLSLGLERFRVALETIQELAKKDKLLPITDLGGSVRFVVDDVQEFAKEYGKKLGAKKLDDKKARDALEEVRGFFQLALFFQGENARLNVLREEVFGAFKGLSAAQKKRENDVWREKFKLVEKHAIYRRLSEREKRLRTSIAPCVMDAVTELVQTRRVGRDDRATDLPFLRVSLSYIQRGETGFPFGYLRFHPWNDMTKAMPGKSFEFECDESDIDLLVRRLLAAKVLLASEVARKEREGIRS